MRRFLYNLMRIFFTFQFCLPPYTFQLTAVICSFIIAGNNIAGRAGRKTLVHLPTGKFPVIYLITERFAPYCGANLSEFRVLSFYKIFFSQYEKRSTIPLIDKAFSSFVFAIPATSSVVCLVCSTFSIIPSVLAISPEGVF